LFNVDPQFQPTRRDLFAALFAAPVAAAVGCGANSHPPLQGEFVGPASEWGHRLRDEPAPTPAAEPAREVGVLIVGSGIAGLAAARRLRQAGFDDFLVCELETRAGGTSASGQSRVTAYPWGAHYLPVPQASNEALVSLLEEMQVIVGRDDSNEPIVAEQFLCRAPQERLFMNGAWHSELDPLADATPAERAEADEFAAEVDRWAGWQDREGRRAFTLPLARGSDDPQPRELDALTMGEWFERRGWKSPRLRWLIDYGCRDDYGLTIDQTSAWAGLFYAASRKRDRGAASQPLMTWPAGNGRIVEHLLQRAADRVRLETLVRVISPRPSSPEPACDVVVQDTRTGALESWRAKRVIFAAPQFVARRVVRGYDEARGADVDQFQYGSWLVANLHLRERPIERHAPLAWDNVLYDSPSLGYVAATHQEGSDYGPTVWTYYLPFCGEDPRQDRRQLDELSWERAAEFVLKDLEQAHPDLRPRVERLDVMRWGHAMIRPVPGFITGGARRRASEPWQGVHFAHTDLSGVALLEEAFFHGERAAKEVLEQLADRAAGGRNDPHFPG